MPGSGEKVKINNKMRKLFRKRAREYNSDDDDDVDEDGLTHDSVKIQEVEGWDSSDAEGDDGMNVDAENEEYYGDEENGEIQPGIANFTEGSRAFKSILKNGVADDALGSVLSAHKKLVAEKLAEEEAEWKVKGEAKMEKHMVNKAQNAQKGLNPSRNKDVKVLKKRRKETFFSELGKTSVSTADASSKGSTSSGTTGGEGPAWAPLRDNYMLTISKLKDWDEMPDSTVADETGKLSEYGSSDDDRLIL